MNNQSGFSLTFAERHEPQPVAFCYIELFLEGVKYIGDVARDALVLKMVEMIFNGIKTRENDVFSVSLRADGFDSGVSFKRADGEQPARESLKKVLNDLSEKTTKA